VVVSWWGFSTTLWYAQFVEGRRADVFVVDDRTRLDHNLGDPNDVIDRYLGRRPVYLIRLPYDLAPFLERYELSALDVPWDRVYRIDGRRDEGSADL
ncbi:MAG: hypothetical protein M3253_03240, partial [Chloroflexota bacterium]|nr:hypothetical protein [Chloroflexota bacterium]